MSKLEFHIVEIPEGESSRLLALEPEDLDLSPYTFKGGDITLEFYRTLHFIRVNFALHTQVQVKCDRSLDYFDFPVDTDYEVVFKVDVEEESEDENGAIRRFNFSSNTFSIKDEVRDSVMLHIPMQNIHPRYLDDEGYVKEFDTQQYGDVLDDDDEQNIDPRWEDLKKLKD